MRKYEVTINDKDYSVLVKKFEPDAAELEINGKRYSIRMEGPIRTISSSQYSYTNPITQTGNPTPPSMPIPQTTRSSVAAPIMASRPAMGEGTDSTGIIIRAPIPGSILEILIKEGDYVQSGQTLLKMEAMKMENEINATTDGTVKSIKVSTGEAVNQGQELLEIESGEKA